MKKNRLTIVLLLALVLLSVYLLFFKSGFNTIGNKDNDFAVKDTAAITKIFIANKNNQNVTLTRTGAGSWMVNAHYPVRSDAINLLLYTMKSLTVKNVLDDKARSTVIKSLATGAVKVEVYAGDKKIKEYYVGQETADELGTYMLLVNPETGENYEKPYIIYIPGFDGYLTTRYFIKEDDWRDRTVFQYYPYDLKSVTLTYPVADSSFRINILGKNKFELENPVTNQKIAGFDTIAVKQYLTYYQSVSWETTANATNGGDKKDSILHTPPFAVIRVEDAKGKVSIAKLYHRAANDIQKEKYGIDYKYDPDRMFVYVNDADAETSELISGQASSAQVFALGQYYVFGKLLQPVSYFINKSSYPKPLKGL